MPIEISRPISTHLPPRFTCDATIPSIRSFVSGTSRAFPECKLTPPSCLSTHSVMRFFRTLRVPSLLPPIPLPFQCAVCFGRRAHTCRSSAVSCAHRQWFESRLRADTFAASSFFSRVRLFVIRSTCTVPFAFFGTGENAGRS